MTNYRFMNEKELKEDGWVLNADTYFMYSYWRKARRSFNSSWSGLPVSLCPTFAQKEFSDLMVLIEGCTEEVSVKDSPRKILSEKERMMEFFKKDNLESLTEADERTFGGKR